MRQEITIFLKWLSHLITFICTVAVNIVVACQELQMQINHVLLLRTVSEYVIKLIC